MKDINENTGSMGLAGSWSFPTKEDAKEES